MDSPNVCPDSEKKVTGLTTARWVEENPIYRARVLGEFPDQAEDTLISRPVLLGGRQQHRTARGPQQ